VDTRKSLDSSGLSSLAARTGSKRWYPHVSAGEVRPSCETRCGGVGMRTRTSWGGGWSEGQDHVAGHGVFITATARMVWRNRQTFVRDRVGRWLWRKSIAHPRLFDSSDDRLHGQYQLWRCRWQRAGRDDSAEPDAERMGSVSVCGKPRTRLTRGEQCGG